MVGRSLVEVDVPISRARRAYLSPLIDDGGDRAIADIRMQCRAKIEGLGNALRLVDGQRQCGAGRRRREPGEVGGGRSFIRAVAGFPEAWE
jgi:hypothetical protein